MSKGWTVYVEQTGEQGATLKPTCGGLTNEAVFDTPWDANGGVDAALPQLRDSGDSHHVRALLKQHEKRQTDRLNRMSSKILRVRRMIERQDERRAKGAAAVASIFGVDNPEVKGE